MTAFYEVPKVEEVQAVLPAVNKPSIVAVKEIKSSLNILHVIILAQFIVIVVLICMLL